MSETGAIDMDSVMFVVILAVFGVIAWWYAGNELAGRDGDAGVPLALHPASNSEKPAERGPRYRTRERSRDLVGKRPHSGVASYAVRNAEAAKASWRPRGFPPSEGDAD